MTAGKPKRIGLLIGREWSWPSALIAEINGRDAGVVAEFVKIGETRLDSPSKYDLLIDRMSHEIPYYRTFLRYAALHGAYIVNDPFMTATDDKFFGVSLAHKLDIRTPRTVVLPNKRVETENVPESFRNLVYPMDWQAIIDYVGVPAILKDVLTGGRPIAQIVHDVDELIRWYDESDTLTVVLQELIEADLHVHCFVIGRQRVLPVCYSVEEQGYLPEAPQLKERTAETIRETALHVTRAIGYDINMVEYVVADDTPYLINPGNPMPNLDINLLTPGHFDWCVQNAADFVISTALQPSPQFQSYGWCEALDLANAM